MCSQQFLKISNLFKNQEIKTGNHLIDNVIGKFHFLLIFDKDFDIKINNIENKSNIIAIHKCGQYLMLCFDGFFIIIAISYLYLMNPFFTKNQKSMLYFTSNEANEFFARNIGKLQYLSNSDSDLQFQIQYYQNKFYIKEQANRELKNYFWRNSCDCYFKYLIMKSYSDMKFNRIENPQNYMKKVIDKEIKEDEYIVLDNLSYNVELIYHVYLEKIFVKKLTDQRFFEREHSFYINCNHPFIPKYIGTVQNEEYKMIIIEYIKGKELSDIKHLNLEIKDKMKIIFELLIIIQFLHFKGYIYRDLKPDNVIIDEYKNIVLIDFDRLVGCDSNGYGTGKSNELGAEYIAPEIFKGNDYSFSADIYSLGKLIYFILCENDPNLMFFQNFYQNCVNENPLHRPTISKLILDFLININPSLKYYDKIDKNLIQVFENNASILDDYNYNREIYFTLSNLYHSGKYIKPDFMKFTFYCSCLTFGKKSDGLFDMGTILLHQDINKAMEYYKQSAKLNNIEAQYKLGLMYYFGDGIQYNINKAIKYFTLAANNKPDAAYFLSYIYSSGKIEKDIDKAIYFGKLGADKNHVYSQFYLVDLYLECEKGNKDENIKNAMHYLQLAANQNFPNALYNLGYYLLHGQYLQKDVDKAIQYFEIAANFNLSNAQTMLGTIYYSDEYNKKNIPKSIHYYNLAANNGDSQAQFQLAIIYRNNENIELSLHYLHMAADNQDVNAQFELGMLYLNGNFIRNDRDLAVKYLTLAANQNHKIAQFNLGVIYFKNNIYKSIEYFTKSANNGFVYAQINLAVFYYEGKLIKKDIKNAIYYYTLAANQNFPQALYNLGYIYQNGIGVVQDMEASIYYYEKVSENNIWAQFNLGKIYVEGYYAKVGMTKVLKKDIRKGINYYLKAANKNHGPAFNQLANLFLNGIYVEKNIPKAIELLKKAVDLNIPESLTTLGTLYHLGEYIHQDINKAIQLFERAAHLEYPLALCKLAIIYYRGSDAPQNIDKAFKYLNIAAKQDFTSSFFILGFYYQSGLFNEKNLDHAIFNYKKITHLNAMAKNNLAVIYISKKSVQDAIIYLDEATKNDVVLSMYNLASIYFYGKENFQDLTQSINLLIKSYNKGFKFSLNLLSFALIKKIGSFDIKKISLLINDNGLKNEVIDLIKLNKLYYPAIFDERSKYFENSYFVYNEYELPFEIDLSKENHHFIYSNNSNKVIDSSFYDGFGNDIQ